MITTVKGLKNLALGLNIEGCFPYKALEELNKRDEKVKPEVKPQPFTKVKWYNLVVAVDAPLEDFTFEALMEKKAKHEYDLIETAAGMDRETFLRDLLTILHKVSEGHSCLLVHVHQYEGSTALVDILRKEGFLTISDKTNWHEGPVDYAKDWPQIDGLFSLSQCAGLGAAPGEWIVPTAYYPFDVKTNLVVKASPPFVNSLNPSDLPIHVYRGPLLVVNDLWNPSMGEMDDDLLVLEEEEAPLLDFLKTSTQCFDESHSWVHAVEVAKRATKILPTKDVLYLALLHDVCDHKYPDALPREALSSWIEKHLPTYTYLDPLIDQVSYSKQAKTEGKFGKSSGNPVLDAVRDADRIEALGKIGITRCLTFCRTRLEADQDPLPSFIRHAHEKLLRLLPCNFICTKRGKALALPYHQVLLEFVQAVLPVYPYLLALFPETMGLSN